MESERASEPTETEQSGLIVNLSHFRSVVKQFVGFIVLIRPPGGVTCIRVGAGQRAQDSEGPTAYTINSIR